MQESRSPSNRFLDPLTLGEAARTLGWVLLVALTVGLWRPVALNLFAFDGEMLEPELQAALAAAHVVAGVVGLALLAFAYHARGTHRPLPLRRGWAAVLVLAAVLAGGVAELGFRIREWRQWGSFWRTRLGSAEKCGQEYRNLQPGRYGSEIESDFDRAGRRTIFYTINRYGIRGPMPTVPKPPGRKRVVCLGGSSTFGWTVTDGEAWPARLGEVLGKRGDVDVINAGRPGATTWSNFRYLRDRLLALEPDVLVLYEGFNDMWRGARRHSEEQADYGLVDASLPPAQEALDLGEPRPWPLRLSFSAHALGEYLRARLKPNALDRWPTLPPGFRPDPAIVALYEQNLGAEIRLAKSRGITTIVATFAGCDDPRLSEDEQKLRLRYVLKQVKTPDNTSSQAALDLYRNVTRDVARREGVYLLDLAERMEKDTVYYADTIHYTARGEERLAQHVADGIVPLIWAGSARSAKSVR